MPELPEVETVRRQLDERLQGLRLSSVRIFQSGREFPVGEIFVEKIVGHRLVHVHRRAKLLLWDFEDGLTLIAHLKMTGRFVFVDEKTKPGKHDRILFVFSDEKKKDVFVMWSDVRKFGFVKLIHAKEREEILSQYGPEPLENSEEELAKRFELPKTRNVKAALLNQEVVAGVGNIYADEALYRAGILPTRILGKMTSLDRLELAKQVKTVLVESIAQQGTSANDYVDTRGEKGGFLELLRVYGREGEACQICKTPISKIVLNQRGTHFCARCQK